MELKRPFGIAELLDALEEELEIQRGRLKEQALKLLRAEKASQERLADLESVEREQARREAGLKRQESALAKREKALEADGSKLLERSDALEVAEEDLHRHLAAEIAVERPVDDAHSAAADLLLDDIAAGRALRGMGRGFFRAARGANRGFVAVAEVHPHWDLEGRRVGTDAGCGRARSVAPFG